MSSFKIVAKNVNIKKCQRTVTQFEITIETSYFYNLVRIFVN